jgi:hypothetical protein
MDYLGKATPLRIEVDLMFRKGMAAHEIDDVGGSTAPFEAGGNGTPLL